MPAIFLAGCSSGPLELKSDMKLEGSFKLEGPVTIQMSGPEIQYDGTFVSEELFNRIELGRTSRLWVVTVLGDPDRSAVLADGSEVLVWSYSLSAIAGQMVEVLKFGEDEKQRPATLTTVVRFVDGVVEEKWRG